MLLALVGGSQLLDRSLEVCFQGQIFFRLQTGHASF
jgi:hypothetical protein